MLQKLQIKTQTMNKRYGKFKDGIILQHCPSAWSSQSSEPSECHAMRGAQTSCIQLRLTAIQFLKLWTNFYRIHPTTVRHIKHWYSIYLSKLWTVKQNLPRLCVQGTSRYAGWCGTAVQAEPRELLADRIHQLVQLRDFLSKCLRWFLLFHYFHPQLSSNRVQLYVLHISHNLLSEFLPSLIHCILQSQLHQLFPNISLWGISAFSSYLWHCSQCHVWLSFLTFKDSSLFQLLLWLH